MQFVVESHSVVGSNKGVASIIIAVIIFIVLGIIFLVWGMLTIKKSETMSELALSMLMQKVDVDASPLERAIICAYYRCVKGCGWIPANTEKLTWRNETGGIESCATSNRVCPPTGGPPDGKYCGDESEHNPIIIKITDEEEGKLNYQILRKYTGEGLCIFVDGVSGGPHNRLPHEGVTFVKIEPEMAVDRGPYSTFGDCTIEGPWRVLGMGNVYISDALLAGKLHPGEYNVYMKIEGGFGIPYTNWILYVRRVS